MKTISMSDASKLTAMAVAYRSPDKRIRTIQRALYKKLSDRAAQVIGIALLEGSSNAAAESMLVYVHGEPNDSNR
jgi:hypothetical protein